MVVKKTKKHLVRGKRTKKVCQKGGEPKGEKVKGGLTHSVKKKPRRRMPLPQIIPSQKALDNQKRENGLVQIHRLKAIIARKKTNEGKPFYTKNELNPRVKKIIDSVQTTESSTQGKTTDPHEGKYVPISNLTTYKPYEPYKPKKEESKYSHLSGVQSYTQKKPSNGNYNSIIRTPPPIGKKRPAPSPPSLPP